MLHGRLTGSNIIFNSDGVIQITDFCMNRLIEQEGNSGGMIVVGGFSGES
jgi:tRNA A-37 threonylcarbamoyl transferase component Bud32